MAKKDAEAREVHVIVMAALAYVRCECKWEYRLEQLKIGEFWKTDEELMYETIAAFNKHKKRKEA